MLLHVNLPDKGPVPAGAVSTANGSAFLLVEAPKRIVGFDGATALAGAKSFTVPAGVTAVRVIASGGALRLGLNGVTPTAGTGALIPSGANELVGVTPGDTLNVIPATGAVTPQVDLTFFGY